MIPQGRVGKVGSPESLRSGWDVAGSRGTLRHEIDGDVWRETNKVGDPRSFD